MPHESPYLREHEVKTFATAAQEHGCTVEMETYLGTMRGVIQGKPDGTPIVLVDLDTGKQHSVWPGYVKSQKRVERK